MNELNILGLELPDSTSLEEWSHIGSHLVREGKEKEWQMCDFAAFGERKYGKLKEFADANGINYQTLRHSASLGRNIKPCRRRHNLDRSVYMELKQFSDKVQAVWIERIEEEHLTIGAIRKAIRQSKGEGNALESEGRSFKMGTKLYDEFLDWLKKRPEDFWTSERVDIWKARIKELSELIPPS